METYFYEISQNNSGGSFDVDDKLCHRLIVEAKSRDEAIQIAESLGCYWDGVDSDMDCPCCGDRWYRPYEAIDLDEINTKWNGYEVYEYLNCIDVPYDNIIDYFKSKYPGAEWLVEPVVDSYKISGKIKLDSIEQYAQISADLWGWTKPDYRIFYKNGDVKNIYSKKIK